MADSTFRICGCAATGCAFSAFGPSASPRDHFDPIRKCKELRRVATRSLPMPRRRGRSSHTYDRDQDDCRLADMIRAGRSARMRSKSALVGHNQTRGISRNSFGMSDLCQKQTHAPSMIFSAKPTRDSGRVRLSAFAVWRLITSSTLSGCHTGLGCGGATPVAWIFKFRSVPPQAALAQYHLGQNSAREGLQHA